MTVRSRSRGGMLGQIGETGVTWNVKTGARTVLPTTNAPVMEKLESMRDHVNEGGRRVNHDVYHYLYLHKFGVAHARRYEPLANGDMYETFRSTAGQAKIHQELPSPVNPGRIDWDQAWAALFNDAWGAFPGESTLLVNIAEFASLKSMFRELAGVLKGRLLSNLRALIRRRWDSPIHTLMQDHLTFKFGVMPFLTDTANAFTAYEACRQRWDALRRSQGLREVRGYAPWQPTNFQRSYQSSRFPWKTVHVTQMQTCKAGITAMCQFQMVPAAAVMTRLMLSKLGVLNPLVAAWNIVPFSFLLDRVIPISKGLDRISPYQMVTGKFLGSPVESISLSKISTFEKVETQVETSQRGKDPGPGKGELLRCDEWSLTRTYTRTIGAPIYTPYALPALRGFSSSDEGTFQYGNTVMELFLQHGVKM